MRLRIPAPSSCVLALGKRLLPALLVPTLILPEDAWEGPTEIVKERLRVLREDQLLKPSTSSSRPLSMPGAPVGFWGSEVDVLLPNMFLSFQWSLCRSLAVQLGTHHVLATSCLSEVLSVSSRLIPLCPRNLHTLSFKTAIL